MGHEYKETKDIRKEDLGKLYGENHWELYTKDLDSLQRAVKNSLYVRSVWDRDKLIALIRAIGDNEHILYIQDILILPEYQRQGIGTKLVSDILDKYKHVRQKALLTGTTEKQSKFYRSLGFKEPAEIECVSFVRHDV